MKDEGAIAAAIPQSRLWTDAELQPIGFGIRALSSKEGAIAADRTAYLRLIIEHGDYFQANDMWGLPTREQELNYWIDGSNRVVVGAFDGQGACVGFCGADRSAFQFRTMNLWYGVAPNAQGRGLARELAHEALAMLYSRFPTTADVSLGCRDSNLASQKVALALGLTRNSADDYRAALSSAAPVCNYLIFGGPVEDVQRARSESPQICEDQPFQSLSSDSENHERLRA